MTGDGAGLWVGLLGGWRGPLFPYFNPPPGLSLVRILRTAFKEP